VKQKYHPVDAARLRHLVAGLLPSYGKVDLDVHYTIRGLLVTLAEPNKLHGYVGTIRGEHAHEDITAIIEACLLRDAGRVGTLARTSVPIGRLVPPAPVPGREGDSPVAHHRPARAAALSPADLGERA
jgi:hypothetical protein